MRDCILIISKRTLFVFSMSFLSSSAGPVGLWWVPQWPGWCLQLPGCPVRDLGGRAARRQKLLSPASLPSPSAFCSGVWLRYLGRNLSLRHVLVRSVGRICRTLQVHGARFGWLDRFVTIFNSFSRFLTERCLPSSRRWLFATFYRFGLRRECRLDDDSTFRRSRPFCRASLYRIG